MGKAKRYQAAGKSVDRASFRALWIESQVARFGEEMEEEMPTKRGRYTTEQWNSILEIRTLVQELQDRMQAWAEAEKGQGNG